ncbi:MAG: transcriptional regulator [Alicyclobacillus sp. RIFOXYA1_FULL_53_8]|nr:MAG: transcriptional regulator [Alicyclobacillus sp. RIFOXYA1_FULL_53_8]
MSSEHDHKHSYAPIREDLLTRLRRVEGQVRGIEKMIESDRYCVDILVQLAAIKSAVHQVALSLLESHTRGCVADAISSHQGAEDKIDELMDVIKKFTRG